MEVKPDDRQVGTASGTLQQTRTAIESSFFSVDSPWLSRSAYSVETFRAQLAQEIGIAALISRSHYTTTIEMTVDPLCHISLMGALHRTDLDLDLGSDTNITIFFRIFRTFGDI